MPLGWDSQSRSPPEDAVLELIPHRAKRSGRVLTGTPRGLSSYLLTVGTALTHWMFTQPEQQLSDFLIERVLGRGAYGVVVLVRQRSVRGRAVKLADQLCYAMKLQSVSNQRQSRVMQSKLVIAERERDILRKLSHPFVIRLIHYFEVPERTWTDASTGEVITDKFGCVRQFHKAIVMEYCPEGDLECHILKHASEAHLNRDNNIPASLSAQPDDEDFLFLWLMRMRRFTAEISVALQFLHGHSVTYRDLKPANTLLKWWADEQLHVCMSDFGHSKAMTDEDRPESLAGTALYAAPEILDIHSTSEKRSYSQTVDNYSFGRMIIVMLWRTKFMSDEYELVMPEPDEYDGDPRVPVHAVNLIKILTQEDPRRRGDLGALGAHPFFCEFLHLDFSCPAIQWSRLTHGSG